MQPDFNNAFLEESKVIKPTDFSKIILLPDPDFVAVFLKPHHAKIMRDLSRHIESHDHVVPITAKTPGHWMVFGCHDMDEPLYRDIITLKNFLLLEVGERQLPYKNWIIDTKKEADFLRVVDHLLNDHHDANTAILDRQADRRHLDSQNIHTIRQRIVQADLSDCFDQQSIWVFDFKKDDMGTDAANQVVIPYEKNIFYDELFLSLSKIHQKLFKDMQITQDPLLFRYITKALDRKTLDYIIKMGLFSKKIGINLNLSTILSPAFTDFIKKVPSHYLENIHIEMTLLDIINQPHHAQIALYLIRKHAMKSILDQVGSLHLPMLRWNDLGMTLGNVDFIKCDMGLLGAPGIVDWAQKMVKKDNNSNFSSDDFLKKIIIHRCGKQEDALHLLNQDFTLLQGYGVDHL